jgi:hypothetical protein
MSLAPLWRPYKIRSHYKNWPRFPRFTASILWLIVAHVAKLFWPFQQPALPFGLIGYRWGGGPKSPIDCRGGPEITIFAELLR